jgi:hypothetical protein
VVHPSAAALPVACGPSSSARSAAADAAVLICAGASVCAPPVLRVRASGDAKSASTKGKGRSGAVRHQTIVPAAAISARGASDRPRGAKRRTGVVLCSPPIGHSAINLCANSMYSAHAAARHRVRGDGFPFMRAILQRICDGVELRYVKWNILRADTQMLNGRLFIYLFIYLNGHRSAKPPWQQSSSRPS